MTLYHTLKILGIDPGTAALLIGLSLLIGIIYLTHRWEIERCEEDAKIREYFKDYLPKQPPLTREMLSDKEKKKYPENKTYLQILREKQSISQKT